jgi:Bacterial protein of unknown function (DUF853)
MTQRLAGALIDQIRSDITGGSPSWMLIEGIDVALAREILRAWPDGDFPTLRVVAPANANFGEAALGGATATSLRNKNGMCLILCEGQRIDDYQSVRSFERYSPSDLMTDEDGFDRLALQTPAVPRWDAAVIKQALFDAKLMARPSARAVSRFFDVVATDGHRPGEAMALLGGFRDVAATFTTVRLIDNLNLSARRSEPELLRPTSLAEIRTRATRRLAERFDDARLAADGVAEMLLNQDDELLSFISFDEARDILEEPPASELPEQVREDLRAFKRGLEEAVDQAAIDRWIRLADDLADLGKARVFARDLLDYDANEHERVFATATRRKLRGLLRERSLRVDAIEEGLVRAILSLPSKLVSIELKEPGAPEEPSSEAHAKAVLARAVAHVRIAPLLRALQHEGVQVSGDLLLDPRELLRAALEIIDRPSKQTLRRVALVLRGETRSHAVEVSWTPTVEDLVLLVAASKFAFGSPALSLRASVRREEPLSSSSLAESRPPERLQPLAERLREAARNSLEQGYDERLLAVWAADWARAVDVVEADGTTEAGVLEEIALAGTIRFGDEGDVALTHLHPLKAEWLSQRTAAWLELLDWAYHGRKAEGDELAPPIVQTARALASAGAAQYPAFLASPYRRRHLLPTADGAIFSAFGESRVASDVAPPPVGVLEIAVRKLIGLHPEAGSHFRCVAWQDAGADLAVRALVATLKSSLVQRAEIFCVAGSPATETLDELDQFARGDDQGRLAIRYIDDFSALDDYRGPAGAPAAHMAVVSGITEDGQRLQLDTAEIPMPPHDDDVLFMPKTWVRPNKERRILLAPPRVSRISASWFKLMTAIDDAWPEAEGAVVRIPEISTDPAELRRELIKLHELALWVVTIDRYAARDSLEAALGDEIAILHQERRVTGSSPEGIVISQKSGGAADRAIARSLRASGLADEANASEIAIGLRKAASRGYGILALRAATSGSGINELLGQVCSFSRLASEATPWPLPPGCRVLLISLDEYTDWFGRGRRADLLALALSPEEGGVHCANLEVKAVKSMSGAVAAAGEAKEQLRQTLNDSRFAAYPNGSLFSRLWLNRIAEAAVGVSRENRFRLGEDDLAALDAFRRGLGTLEWAGLGLVFRPGAPEAPHHYQHPLLRDRVPILISALSLTPELLKEAAQTDPTQLRTADSGRPTLPSSSKTRRVNTESTSTDEATFEDAEVEEGSEAGPEEPADATTRGQADAEIGEATYQTDVSPEPSPEVQPALVHPELGWDVASGEPVRWRVVGEGALSNGHIEIYGTSGAGKTQFVKSLLMQLSAMGSHFGVCDFKNDYGDEFPEESGAAFYDLWRETVPYNPLATDNPTRRSLQGLIIELRDTVDIAARAFTRLGHRQLHKLQDALESAYEEKRRMHNSFPTLQDVHGYLDDDLRGVVGDLTGTDLFGEGPPLGELIDDDVIFGLNHIPGTGLTTTLAAGFILASLYLKLLEMPQIHNEVKYTLVIDEAHRVASFHSVGTMVRELRSKGLAVILATQRPGDLPGEAGTNAQTKIYMRLPDAQSATAAARALDPSNRDLSRLIRSLGDGEAFVALAGSTPKLVRLRQFWRDH